MIVNITPRAAVAVKPLSLALLVSAGVVLAPACKQEATTSGSGGGDDTAASVTASTADTTVTAASTSGGACSLEGTDACTACMAGACCDAHVACQDDPVCWACVTGTDEAACGSNPASHELQTAYLECYGGPCNDACIGAAGACDEAAEVYEPTCGACLEQSCCEELGACFAHEGCWTDCVTDHDPQGCHEVDAHALFYALGSCAQTSCSEACSTGPQFEPLCMGIPDPQPSTGSCIVVDAAKNLCNPITNEGCTEMGSACDTNMAGDGFQCYPAPNDNALCEACGQQEGYCLPGHTCAGQCLKYCCDDADCGAGGVCNTEILSGLIGLCVLP